MDEMHGMNKLDEMDKIPMLSQSSLDAQEIKLPRVTITFCTQCRWLLRAAYFAQELLSTFGNDIGEVALQPSTGGIFIVELFTNANATGNAGGEAEKNAKEGEKEVKILKHTLWNRKSEGGFPETKELKKRLRNIIDPSRDLGHVDGKKSTTTMTSNSSITAHSSDSTSTTKSTEEEKGKEETAKEIETEIETKEKANIGEEKKDGEKQDAEKLGEEKVNERGKIVITGLEGEGGFGFCVPGEDCGGF
ncbi:2c68bb95-822a-4f30-9bba-20bc9c602c4b [Sclerotinia trifoliorum]|uniref:2c68bb95-822a-4f30-9bba-20bc9c602c4b n=1 Tax=Sclerotinia trifoliorum TaxID=28548 RepID=A0A8H2W4H4_9HELO|nr:2c68bb95-822a-4f30-9bba-20bc9c602c4b [Sclerotinia trifoliorum]